jgi:hypothetical protein
MQEKMESLSKTKVNQDSEKIKNLWQGSKEQYNVARNCSVGTRCVLGVASSGVSIIHAYSKQKKTFQTLFKHLSNFLCLCLFAIL